MAKIRKIDLSHAISFIGLLMCKQELARMDAGSILEVTMDNPDFNHDLIKIVDRSPDRIIENQRSGSMYKVCIRKGCSKE